MDRRMIADFIRRLVRRRAPQPVSRSTSRAARPVIAPQPGSVAERAIATTTVLPSGRLRACARTARGVGRLAAITVWVPLSVGFEAVLLLVPGTAKIRWTRMVWGGLCLLLSLRIRVVGRRAGGVGGRRARQNGERPVIYVSNHSSWLDVPVLGTVLPSNFVAKGDIEGWPIMGLVSRIGRTIFVSRQRSTTGRERDEMLHRLMVEGDNLILFPEGTSSDGSRVLPFLSAFFAIAKPPRLPPGKGPVAPESEAEAIAARPGMTPLIQPVSVVYDRLEGLPVNHARRPVFAWYGDMELGPHVWQLVKWRSMRATVLLHAPLDPDDFPSRKALAQAAWRAVAAGAAELRQNQPQPENETAYACRPLAGMLPQDLERNRN
ncbi:acyl-phosphate glycerol 3-phosphate acyltransferase [Komagataeibacter xylinus]|uniref:1-acyl-sn-glycerol-3-phosphate acyltransferase n=2 Tax=Komagataeibacter swingsii TaxID=215220 RepID=A0A850P081_9PROT|nr:1-acyl-sn-glycerol-3-phosphate acyltransferase [Komagataeibacter swingsii]RFP02226.1 acyl-phosphate glycerol 3-phosphate acyltransferase [Komagataeibacter xylinus]RFP03171.1 acyl-phosphate glycerol 3-phosphate acyltransferase [Komagataeibacter xylinus]